MKHMSMDVAGRGVQYFDYGPLQFNVKRAALLAAGRKYRPEPCRPSPEWIRPNIDIDPRHVDRCDPSRPVLFVTFPLPGHPERLLIDGNHRVAHALKHQKNVRAITLDLADTLKVVSGPENLIQQIRSEGQRRGLLPATA